MMKRIWACCLAIAIVTAMFAVPAIAAETRVTRCNLRMRKQPNANSDVILQINGGTEITVLGTSGGWTKTTYNGHTGYVSSDYLMELTRSGYYPLREGDENPYVKDLQTRLIELGYMTGSADGKYGATTLEAVKRFQKNNKISVDGIAGGETQRIMFSDKAVASSGETAPAGTSTTTPTTDTSTSTEITSSTTATTLKLGSRGDDVKTLQARLIELGYLSGKADGVFGSATEKAVVDFQKRSSLIADGKAGKVTQNLLYSSGAKKADGTTAGSTSASTNTGTSSSNSSATYSTLKRGITSSDVKKLQQKLIDLGYLSTNATGYYGSATYAAVTAFQKAHNLAADGIAGSATQSMLYGGNAKSAGSSSTTTVNTNKTYATLKEGMKSSAVTTLQNKLKDLGYFNNTATGYYGSVTKSAVVAFQKANNLAADGIAGSATLNKLYGGDAKSASGSSGGNSGGASDTGKISAPSSSQVKLLHWFNEVKPSLKYGSVVQVYDPATGYGWKISAMSLGRHMDSEPLTAEDTAIMNKAFGNKTTWTPKVVWVKLPSGTWTMATMHNTPHLSGSISNNNFNGHLCIHFLRDMDECKQNDPNYGVQNQNAIRAGWKSLTGQTVN